jgi:hypothetical protein
MERALAIQSTQGQCTAFGEVAGGGDLYCCAGSQECLSLLCRYPDVP